MWHENRKAGARIMLFAWEFVLDMAAVGQSAEGEKDLEILLLRQSLRILIRQLTYSQFSHLS